MSKEASGMKQAESGAEMGGMHGLAGVKALPANRGYGSSGGSGPGPGNTSLAAAVACAKKQTGGTDKMGNPSAGGKHNESAEGEGY
jgi:hypothetical protein